MACIKQARPEMPGRSIKVKTEPEDAADDSRIRRSMPALASLLTSHTPAARRNGEVKDAAGEGQGETVTIHGVLRTEPTNGDAAASPSAGKANPAREALKALLCSPIKSKSPSNGATHAYTTRRQSGTQMKKPKKYVSDDLVDSEVLYEMTKQNLLPVNPKPFKSNDITTVRKGSTTIPKLSYIGLSNARQESSTSQEKAKQSDSLQKSPAPAQKNKKNGSASAAEDLILEGAVPYTEQEETSFLKSLLVPHEYNTRTKSGTARMKEDVYTALKHLAEADEQDMSSYSNSGCSEAEGEGASPAKIRRKAGYRTRKRMDLARDPAVYPRSPLPPSPLASTSTAVPSPKLPDPEPKPAPTKVPKTCSCKFGSSIRSSRSIPVLTLLLTGDEIIEKNVECNCTIERPTDLSIKVRKAAMDNEKHSGGDAGTKAPLMASILLTRMAKAVRKTNEREYVPGSSTSPDGDAVTCKQYTDSPSAEKDAQSVLQLLLTTSSPQQNQKTSPQKKAKRKRRAAQVQAAEERSTSSSPEPSALHSLLTQKPTYLSSNKRKRKQNSSPAHVPAHAYLDSPESLVGSSSVYIDNAERNSPSMECASYHGNSKSKYDRQTDASSSSGGNLPILNSLLVKRAAGNQGKKTVTKVIKVAKPGKLLNPAPMDYSTSARLSVKEEPDESMYQLDVSSVATRTSWGAVRVTTQKPKVICIQPIPGWQDGNQGNANTARINPREEYIDMEDLKPDQMPSLKITSVQSLSGQNAVSASSSPVPEPSSSPATVCNICGSAFKSVLLLAMHKDKVHGNHGNKPGPAKRKKSLNSILNSCLGSLSPSPGSSGQGEASRSASASPAPGSGKQTPEVPMETNTESCSTAEDDDEEPVIIDVPCYDDSPSSPESSSSDDDRESSPVKVVEENAKNSSTTKQYTTAHVIHVCETCNKIFKSSSELVSHRLSHEQDKYRCTKCDKSFSLNDVYKKHVTRCHS